MQTEQGCEDPMRQGRVGGKSSGIIRSSVRLGPVFYLDLQLGDVCPDKVDLCGRVQTFKPHRPHPRFTFIHVDFPILTGQWRSKCFGWQPDTVLVRTHERKGCTWEHSRSERECLSLRMGGSISKSTQGLYQTPIRDIHVGDLWYHEPRYKFSNVFLNFSSATAFSSSIPTVMRRHPWHPI
jgi:hypothetical protein